MIKVNELKANISERNGKTKLALTSASAVDKATDNVIQTTYDYLSLSKVTELLTVIQPLIYSDGQKVEETYYFVKLNDSLKLVSEQAFKLIKKAVLNSKKVFKDENIPANSALGEEYINKFYKYQEQF